MKLKAPVRAGRERYVDGCQIWGEVSVTTAHRACCFAVIQRVVGCWRSQLEVVFGPRVLQLMALLVLRA